MRNFKVPKNLVPELENGFPIKHCKATVVMAKVIEYTEDNTTNTYYDLDGKISQRTWSGEKRLTFWVKIDDQEFTVKQTFQLGDVVPILGQWVRGVVIGHQWGSPGFYTSHLMKEESNE